MLLDFSTPIGIFIICAVANCFLNRFAFMTIVIGGFLGFLRYIAVNCYRKGVYCPFPFNF